MENVLFPEFLYGDFNSLHRGTLKLGKVWAGHYLENKEFPTPTQRLVPEGSLIFTADVSDFERLVKAPQWRSYFVRRLRSALTDHLPENVEWESVAAAYDVFTLQFPWGALDAALGQLYPNTLERTASRVHAILAFSKHLQGLRYLDRARKTVGFTELMRGAFGGLITLWLDESTSNLEHDLTRALHNATLATPAVARDRLARRMASIAVNIEDLRRKKLLGSESWLADHLATVDDHKLAILKSGYASELRGELYRLDTLPDS